MSFSVKSSTLDSPKPVNIFYVWYSELCRRMNVTPLSIVKPAKPKNETVLDFVADRIKTEEWLPVLNALRQDTSLHVIAIRSRVECKFLDDVNTERKAREMKRKGGSLYTDFVLKSLISSISTVTRRSQVLTCLELDGLPITTEHFEPLLEALSKNKTIKVLSLKHCPIRDSGCQQLCMCLRYIPNVEVLNLTTCGLGSLSAQYIAKVIRYQQINRYCESWHSSLRYEDPDIGIMCGLKRITLNNNPNIGDEGLTHILNELDDDLWIKALDMQKCNITENISNRLIDVVDYSKSLEVADFRNNDQLCISTIEKILDILKKKQRFGYECEYQWCQTATTLPYEHSINETSSYTSTAESKHLQKSKSAPLKQNAKHDSYSSVPIRRINTFTALPKPGKVVVSKVNLNKAKNEVMELSVQLQNEIAKRIETEEENKELQRKLESIQSGVICKSPCVVKEKNVKFDMSSTAKDKLTRTKEILNITLPTAGEITSPHNESKIEVSKHKNSKSKVEFVFAVDNDKEKTVAQRLFENMLYRSSSDESESCEEEDVLDYFKLKDEAKKSNVEVTAVDDNESSSNASLYRFMEEIKIDANYNTVDHGTKSSSSGSWNQKQPNDAQVDGFQNVLAKISPVR